jgi:hypothetical protein
MHLVTRMLKRRDHRIPIMRNLKGHMVPDIRDAGFGECGHLSSIWCGKLIPSAIVKNSSSLLFVYSTPLLEMECNFRFDTLVPYGTNPLRIHRACSWTTFTTSNYPVNFVKV